MVCSGHRVIGRPWCFVRDRGGAEPSFRGCLKMLQTPN